MRPTDPRREARFASHWLAVSQDRIRAPYFPQKATVASYAGGVYQPPSISSCRLRSGPDRCDGRQRELSRIKLKDVAQEQ